MGYFTRSWVSGFVFTLTFLKFFHFDSSFAGKINHKQIHSNACKAMLKKLDYHSNSPAIWEAIRKAEKAAKSNASVLITGETGTGKEQLAQLIHNLSGRHGAFVPVNVASIADSLKEAEFFGHEQGSFTGATHAKERLIRSAKNGTLFLDELEEMDKSLQATLLRVLETHKVKPVGAQKEVSVNFRLISATNQDLATMVKQGSFKDDLFFRVQVVPIHLIPLRERPEDIELLARHFAKRFCEENDKEPTEFTDAALQKLRSYDWPGNVRELKNLIERAVVLAEGFILDEEDIEIPKQPSFSEFREHRTVRLAQSAELSSENFQVPSFKQFIRMYIYNLLELSKIKKHELAEIWSVNRKTITRHLSALQVGIAPADFTVTWDPRFSEFFNTLVSESNKDGLFYTPAELQLIYAGFLSKILSRELLLAFGKQWEADKFGSERKIKRNGKCLSKPQES